MKSLKILLVFLLVSFFIGASSLKPTASFPSASQSNSTEQYYSVIFDKEGEAAVNAKLSYFNNATDELKNINLEIPGTTVRIISIVQQSIETVKSCARYDFQKPAIGQQRQCLEWRENESGKFVYASIKRDESKDQKTESSLKISLDLPKAIQSQKAGTILIYYKTEGFVDQTWNSFNFAYQTIKSPFDIEYIRVAINVSDDLYIKSDARGETNYKSPMSSKALPALNSTEFSASPQIDDLSRAIPQIKGVIKETSAIDPNENYQVNGKYYTSSWRANIFATAGVVLTFIILIVVLIFVIKKEKRI